jgi:hypothetical protein
MGLGVLAGWPVVDLSWSRAAGDEPPVLAAPAIAPKFEINRLPALPSKRADDAPGATSPVSRSWESRALPSLPVLVSPDAVSGSQAEQRGEAEEPSGAALLGPAKPLQITGEPDRAGAGLLPRRGSAGLPQPPGGVQLKISSPSGGSPSHGEVYVNSPARLATPDATQADGSAAQRRLTSLPAGLHLVSRGQARSLRDLNTGDAGAPRVDKVEQRSVAPETRPTALLATTAVGERSDPVNATPTVTDSTLPPALVRPMPAATADPQRMATTDPRAATPDVRPSFGVPTVADDSGGSIAVAPTPVMAMPLNEWLETAADEQAPSDLAERALGAFQPPVDGSARPKGFANRPVRLVPAKPAVTDTAEAGNLGQAREPQPLRLDVVPFKFSDRVTVSGDYRPFDVPEEVPEPSVSLVAATPMLLIQRASVAEEQDAGPPLPVDWLVAARAKKSNFPDSGIASGDRRLMPGESIHVTLDRHIDRVEVADPALCRAIVVGRREIAIVGIRTGSTQLAVWPLAAAGEAAEPLIYRLEVEEERAAKQAATVSTAGVSELTSLLADMYPTARVEVVQHSNGSMTLQGSVDSNSQARKILDMVRKLYLCPVYDQLTVRN